jgi:hypothetical protein
MKFISQDENNEDYFITDDKKYIVKTISRKQHQNFLKHMLRPYHNRVMEGSFLQRIYGLFKLTYKGEYVRVMVLENPVYDKHINSEPIYISRFIQLITPFVDSLNPECRFLLSDDEGMRFNQIIEKDLCFLKSLQIINFFILIIIKSCTSEHKLTFKGVFEQNDASLTVSISQIICKSSSKKAKRNQAKQEDSEQNIKDHLYKIIN